MNAINRWNPFKEMDELHRQLTSAFGLAPRRQANVASGDENFSLPDWMPLVDVLEDDKEYLIKVELPEVQKNDVRVTVENGTLLVSGERKFEKEEKSHRYHRTERGFGRFERSFSLPEDADPAKVAAGFKDGILNVHLPKSEKAQPKQIEISVS
jgi:HSP20 family protein